MALDARRLTAANRRRNFIMKNRSRNIKRMSRII